MPEQLEYIRHIRSLVGTERVLVPGTVCIIQNWQNEILFQLRADIEMWGCPGGIMDIGETVAESVRRETLEETGLVVGELHFLGIYSGTRYLATYPNGDNIAVVQTAFYTTDVAGELAIDNESLEQRFFSMDALPENIAPHHREPVEDYCAFRLGNVQLPVIQ